MEERVEQAEKQRSAEEYVGLRRVGMGERGDDGGVEHAVDESWHGEEKADDGAGSTDVKEGAGGANRRTNQNEGAERAEKRRRKWNEERIGGVNVVAAAGKEMAEFVGEKDGEQRECERQAGEKRGGIFVEQRQGTEKLVNGSGLLVGVGEGKLRAGDKARGERAEKQRDREQQRTERRVREDGSVKLGSRWERAPVDGGYGVENGVWRVRAHKVSGPKK